MSLQASQSSASRRLALLSLGAIAGVVLVATTGCRGEKESALNPQGEAIDSTEVVPTPFVDSQSNPQGKSGGQQAPAARYVAAGEDRLLAKTFDDLKFDIEVGQRFTRDMLSEEIEQFLGKRIRIRGYILPTNQRKGLTSFVLVRDDQECCFGPGAALYDCIFVEMVPGRTANFAVRPVAVEGRFTLKEIEGYDDVQMAIFHLDGELVE